jgi:hypothetical protein
MKKKKEKTSPICIRFPDKWIETLQSKAREISYQEGKDVNYHDIIREAVFEKVIGVTK